MSDRFAEDELARIADMLGDRLAPPNPRENRAAGVQEALHIVAGSMLSADVETPMPGMSGYQKPLDLHTVEALFMLLQKRTGVSYSAAMEMGS